MRSFAFRWNMDSRHPAISARWSRIAVGAWAGFIFLTSCTVIHSRAFVKGVAQAGSVRVTEQGFQSFWDGWWWFFVKGYHVLEYMILTGLVLRAQIFRRPWSAAVACICFAATDEWHQTFVPDRGGKWTDVVIDAGGVVFATLLATGWTRLKKQAKP